MEFTITAAGVTAFVAAVGLFGSLLLRGVRRIVRDELSDALESSMSPLQEEVRRLRDEVDNIRKETQGLAKEVQALRTIARGPNSRVAKAVHERV